MRKPILQNQNKKKGVSKFTLDDTPLLKKQKTKQNKTKHKKKSTTYLSFTQILQWWRNSGLDAMTDDAQQQQQEASSGALLQVSSSPIGSQKNWNGHWKFLATKAKPASAFFFAGNRVYSQKSILKF